MNDQKPLPTYDVEFIEEIVLQSGDEDGE